jgi:hypothetical protein
MHEHNKHKQTLKIRMHVSNECENERNRSSEANQQAAGGRVALLVEPFAIKAAAKESN